MQSAYQSPSEDVVERETSIVLKNMSLESDARASPSRYEAWKRFDARYPAIPAMNARGAIPSERRNIVENALALS